MQRTMPNNPHGHLIMHVIISLCMQYQLGLSKYECNNLFISTVHFITCPLGYFILIALNTHLSKKKFFLQSTNFGTGTMSKHAFFSLEILLAPGASSGTFAVNSEGAKCLKSCQLHVLQGSVSRQEDLPTCSGQCSAKNTH